MIEYFLNLFPQYRELKLTNEERLIHLKDLTILYNEIKSGKTRVSRIAGMNFKQVEEMKNYYLNATGALPND